MEPAPDWIVGYMDTAIAGVPVVNTFLDRNDRLGAVKVRLSIGRDDYKIPPGLYAVGKPDSSSPVLVTANYKLTFDNLRYELSGLNAWITVIDTKGINVWCAAGKGTFGTAELAGRVNALQLRRIVSHNVLILPQLGAPGVAAHEVFRLCGFRVVYGPVRANDIKKFLDKDMKVDSEMRKVHFGLRERAILTPIELFHNIKPMLLIYLAFFALNIGQPDLFAAAGSAFMNFIPYLAAFVMGCVVVPLLLPWIPFRSFALKGLLAGLIPAVYAALNPAMFGYPDSGWLVGAANLLIIPAVTAFLSLNFTGSTTYTSLSGVKKEMKHTLVPCIAATALGVFLFVTDSIIRFFY